MSTDPTASQDGPTDDRVMAVADKDTTHILSDTVDNNDTPSSFTPVPLSELTREFQIMDSVEWGPRKGDDGYDTDQELAPKPRRQRVEDPCHCQPDRSSDPNDPANICCLDSSCMIHACQEECLANCPAQEYCGNKRIQQGLFHTDDLQVIDCGKKGRGLRLLKPIVQGSLICEYTGRAVKAVKLHRLFAKYQLDRRLYIMALNPQVYLDARQKGGLARFINHSCNPNCKVERWTVKGIVRAVVTAMRDIEPGEELTFDYQWERQPGRALTKCYCQSPNCRGTLEVTKSIETGDYTSVPLVEGDSSTTTTTIPGGEHERWEKMGPNTEDGSGSSATPAIDRTIVNRTVQIFSKEHNQYFVGEITGYDATRKLHSILYRHDMSEEKWEDLRSKDLDWMILVKVLTGSDQYMIAKKTNAMTDSLVADNGDPEGGAVSATDAAAASGRSSLLKHAEQVELKGRRPSIRKNYVYVQTPMKEQLYKKELIERCQRNCSVQIVAEHFARPPLPCDTTNPEEVEKYAALDESQDGLVWKLTVKGANVARAVHILGKNLEFLERLNNPEAAAESGLRASPTAGMIDANGAAAASVGGPTSDSTEVIYPRLIADAVKRKFTPLSERCRNVKLVIMPSQSKSKQFSRLKLEGSLSSDVKAAMEQVWTTLVSLCEEAGVPTSKAKIPRHLGFLGGELSARQFQLLLNCGDFEDTVDLTTGEDRQSLLSMDALEDLAQKSSFFASFQSTYNCSVWVQSDLDMGRIDSSNRLVNIASNDTPRKVFFGCHPKDIDKLWGLISGRVAELSRGVKLLYLARDRVYLPLMPKPGDGGCPSFFDFVHRVTGASVSVDSMTNDHLRVDGRSSQPTFDLTTDTTDEARKASLAKELIRLQIELYRDHFTREQNWIFGRDWTLMTVGSSSSTSSGSLTSTDTSLGSKFGLLDSKTAAQSGSEIAEIVAGLGLPSKVAVHSAVILYRFVGVLDLGSKETSLKAREAALACIFLANKCQKETKYKTLTEVLEAAYETFYPGINFNRSEEGVVVLQDKVISAEKEILETLEYDVFLRDADWVANSAIGSGKMKKDSVQGIVDFAFSGAVLSAGSELWLKYGVEYIFAASAAFLDADLEALLPALGVIPLQVSQAAELLLESSKFGRSGGKKSKTHPLVEGGKERLSARMPSIKLACIRLMNIGPNNNSVATLALASKDEQRYRIVGSSSRRRCAIRNIPQSVVKHHILPIADGVAAESACSIFVGINKGMKDDADVILDGTWRAVAVAEHLLRERVETSAVLLPSVNASNELQLSTKIQAKALPGRVNAFDIHTAGGWQGTIQSKISSMSTKARKVGGKNCIPGTIAESSLGKAGLRWWIPPRNGASVSGSLVELHRVQTEGTDLRFLGDLAVAMGGAKGQFPLLSAHSKAEDEERSAAVSLQQWPNQKMVIKESDIAKKLEDKVGQMGFSPAALQEMQLLTNLHGVIPCPTGHPNFILPVGIAVTIESEVNEPTPEKRSSASIDDPLFSLFRSNEENERVAEKDKKVKAKPHVVFHPTPFVLQKFMPKRRPDTDLRRTTALLVCWFHDLLSALVHCHSNHVIMKTIKLDQIVIDHSGTVKFGAMYRCDVLPEEERLKSIDPVREARDEKRKKRKKEEFDVSKDLYAAPEILLGSPKRTKESDVWSMGCLLAELLLGKPLFRAKDRKSMLAAQYKIVGIPSKSNFRTALKFPDVYLPEKKYSRAVEKALATILKDDGSEYQKPIDLISRMLHLDPFQRCTAEEALSHDYMIEFMELRNSDDFRKRYASEWMKIKDRALRNPDSEAEESSFKKRTAMLMAATVKTNGEDEEDDLYGMSDLLGPSPKKLKH